MSNGTSAGESYVGIRGILGMSIYLMVLCALLFYTLIALWPSSRPLTITSVEPKSGPPGTTLKITGTGFTTGTQVAFGGAPAQKMTRNSETLIEATTPAHSDGPVPVEVRTPNTAVLPSGFSFQSAPNANPPGSSSPPPTSGASPAVVGGPSATASPATPSSSPEATASDGTGGSIVRLFWFSFPASDNLRLLLIIIVVGALGSLIHVMRSFYWYVGNRNLRSSWLLMYVLLPFNGAGLALLFFLIVRGGLSTQAPPTQSTLDGYAALAALVGMFSQQASQKLKQIAESFFNPAEKGKDQAIASSLKLTAVQPAQGPKTGGIKVRLTGTGFSPGCRVTFGQIEATGIVMTSESQMEVLIPARAPGQVDVEVSNSTGQKSSLPNSFTYKDLYVSSISPQSGPQTGGTQVSISGTGFKNGASVKIGGASSTSVAVGSDSTLTATTPPGKAGPADIEVTNTDSSTAVLPAGFSFN
jgi:IPT/TIG domain